MQLTELQKQWHNTYQSAKNARANHEKALANYRERQTAKNWYTDYDLTANANGAVQDLYNAYTELQTIALELYKEVLEYQNAEKKTAEIQQRTFHTAAGTSEMHTLVWRWFFERGGFAAFCSPNCPPENRAQIISIMEQKQNTYPNLDLQKAIDHLKNLQNAHTTK
jgi:hypothetical protein